VSHVQRLTVGSTLMVIVFVLGLFIDAAIPPLLNQLRANGVDDSPFAPVLGAVESTAWVIVPAMLLGIALWMIIGTVRETRRQDRRRVQ